MKREIIQEIENLDNWLKRNKIAISLYKPESLSGHRAIDGTFVIRGIVDAIKTGDLNAIELGCNLVSENKKIPFGRTLKSNIFTALKRQVAQITQSNREMLVKLAIHYLDHPYPPRESKALCRLIKKFERTYSEKVIRSVNRSSQESERWLKYLAN